MKFLPNLGGAGKSLSGFVQRRSTMIFIMRVSVFYVALLSGSIQLLLASPGSGQKLEETYVTVELNNESLQTLFAQIEKQTDLLFTFPEAVKGYTGFELPKGKRSVKETLDLVLEGTPITFRQINNNLIAVFVGGSEGGEGSGGMEGVIIGGSNEVYKPAVFTVTGTVRDGATQEGLAGVNVIVKGTTRGTTTDAEGKYAIDAEEGEILIFSFIGFKAFETQVGRKTVIDIVMESDITALNEVEVRSTGYWTDTKERSTGNIAKVTAKEIENQPVTSPLMALQGRMAGVDVTPYTGVPGSAVKIQIRGQNSLRTDGSYPLYVIDGVPIDSRSLNSAGNFLQYGSDPLGNIDPNNIDKIEVLKDADATSIYGSRGANGVILITTKNGTTNGKTNFDINAYSGIGKISNRLDLLNTSQYLEMRREAFTNDGGAPGILDFDVDGTWDSTRYTDWQDRLLGGSAAVTDIQTGISGGNSTTSFRLVGGFHKENVVFPGDFGYARATGHFGLNHVSNNEKFRATLTVNYGRNRSKLFSESNFLSAALILPPHAPELYDEAGNLNWQIVSLFGGSFLYHSWINPLSYLKKTHDLNSGNLVANSSLSYEVIPGLNLKLNLGYNELNGDEHIRFPINANPPTNIGSSTTGTSIFGNNKRSSWVAEPQITWSRDFGNHSLNTVVGTTWQSSEALYQSIEASGYTSDVLLNSSRGASTVRYISDDETEYRYNAFFARIGYDWKDKYLVNLTGRRDGSSRFGPGNRFGNFGAIGVAWLFSREVFLQNSELLSFGKLRASYGSTGNDQIGDYQFYNTYSITLNKYQSGVSLRPSSLYNPDFAWEVTKKLEGALELGLFGDLVFLEASWYRNRSSNQLVDYPLPSTTGFVSIFSNFNATIENSGWEFLVNTRNVNKSNFRWTTSINLSIPKNKLVEFNGIKESPYSTLYEVGESLSIQRLYTSKGVNAQTGEYELVDMNEDGNIDDNDKKFMKPLGRQYYGGVNNTITYKNFELSFLFQFSNSMEFGYLPEIMPGSRSTNQSTRLLRRWRNEGDKTDIAKFSAANGSFYSSNVRFSDLNTKEVSFVRLKTLSFSYKLPGQLIANAGMQDARVFLQAQNLLTITDYKDVLDPETGNSLPPLRMLTIGFQVKF